MGENQEVKIEEPVEGFNIELTSDGGTKDCKVILNGHDVTKHMTGISFGMEAGEGCTHITLKYMHIPCHLKIDGKPLTLEELDKIREKAVSRRNYRNGWERDGDFIGVENDEIDLAID